MENMARDMEANSRSGSNQSIFLKLYFLVTGFMNNLWHSKAANRSANLISFTSEWENVMFDEAFNGSDIVLLVLGMSFGGSTTCRDHNFIYENSTISFVVVGHAKPI